METTTSVKPEEVLEALLAKRIRRDKAEKLRKLHELCTLEYGRRQGLRDLSPSNMSKVAESHGLFKARTIYNAQSEDYRTLITAWYAYDGPNAFNTIKRQVEPAEKYAFLKKIEDPAIRSLCHLGFIERDKILAELNMLKSKVEVIVDMRPLGATIAPGARNVAIVEAVAQLTDSERNALLAAIDSKSLLDRQWRLGKAGEILDRQDRFVFLPGFATAIAKILGNANLAGTRQK
jgi:hypothetical protein